MLVGEAWRVEHQPACPDEEPLQQRYWPVRVRVVCARAITGGWIWSPDCRARSRHGGGAAPLDAATGGSELRPAWTWLWSSPYYDQAYLVRDVRRYTGITPGEVRPMAANPAMSKNSSQADAAW